MVTKGGKEEEDYSRSLGLTETQYYIENKQ